MSKNLYLRIMEIERELRDADHILVRKKTLETISFYLSLSKNVKRHPELDESENQLYFLRQAYSVLREKGHNLTQKRRRKINIHIGKNMAETYLQNQNMPMFEPTLEHFELFDDREFLEKGYFFYMKNRETEKAEKLIRHIPYKESEDIRLRWQNRRRGPIWNN